MKNEVAVFTTTDLQAAGINSQLTSNDLVEVVAHDIYDKYMESINATIQAGNVLSKKYQSLFDGELNKMKVALKKYIAKDSKIETVEDAEDNYNEDDFETVSSSFGKAEDYWHSMTMSKLSVREKDKGSFIENDGRTVRLPSLKEKNAKVKLVISTSNTSTRTDVKVGSISGYIDNNTQKTFTQVITVPIARFKKIFDEINEYNKQVDDLCKFLPKNGALSVERFTREARVKMNKKIISAQSPEFRKKISELFSIKL